MKPVEAPQFNIPFVFPTYTLTPHAQIMLQKLVDAILELQTENEALKARVTALEAFHP